MFAKIRHPRISGLALFLVLLLLCTASINSSLAEVQAEEPKYGGTFIVGQPFDPPTLNPSLSTHPLTFWPAGQIFSALLRLDEDLNFIPELAESWEVSEDGLTYTFNLVRNATWHDGVPFTSADVKFCIEEVLIPFHPRGVVAFAAVESIETPDDYTVVFKLEHPFPSLMYSLCIDAATLCAKHVYEGTDILANPHNMAPTVGLGPFKFVEWVKGSHITLVRNPNYFKKGLPYLDKVIYRFISDATARYAALEAGEIDWVPPVYQPLSEVDRLIKEKPPGIKVQERPNAYAGFMGLVFNVRNPPFDNIKVRQALQYAIDKQLLCDIVEIGYAVPSHGWIAPTVTWIYNPDVKKYPYDMAKANTLLDEAGYPKGPDGIRFKMTISSDITTIYKKQGELIRELYKDIGVDVTLDQAETVTYRAKIADWDFEAYLQSWGCGPDPILMTQRLFHTNSILKLFASNCGGYSNPEVDALYDQAAREPDRTKQAELFQQIQDIVVEELPYVYLYHTQSIQCWRDEFEIWLDPVIALLGFEYYWWTEGSVISPETAWATIKDTERQLIVWEDKGYNVTDAMEKLDEAIRQYDLGNYVEAEMLAKEALDLAVAPYRPPYELYAIIAAIAIIVVVLGAAYWYKRRPKA